MKQNEFTADIAKKVMELWKEHLGFFYGKHNYYENPQMLVDAFNREILNIGVFQDRVGSRYSDDSKLTIKVIGNQVEFDCYVQAHGVDKKKSEVAEDKFNAAIKEYISTLESKD